MYLKAPSLAHFFLELGRYRFLKSVSVFGFFSVFSKVGSVFGIGFSKYRDIGSVFRFFDFKYWIAKYYEIWRIMNYDAL